MIKKIILTFLALFLVLVVLYLLGPTAQYKPVDNDPIHLNLDIEELEEYISNHEAQYNVKKDNEARIVWADSTKTKTPYALVYLHGFSASHMEGYPIHFKIGKEYGMNTFLPRLHQHGLDSEEPLRDMTPAGLITSAKEALDIAKTLGDSLIIMSCSTGGTLSTILTPKEPRVAGLIMYSPNIDIYDPLSELVTMPWGSQVMGLVLGGEKIKLDYTDEQAAYWNKEYHSSSIIALKTVLNEWMNEDLFNQISAPIYMAYYYKNEEEQDKVVSVQRMMDFYNQVSTPPSKKRKEAFPNTERHVITSPLFSKDYESVEKGTESFLEEILGFKKVTRQEVTLQEVE